MKVMALALDDKVLAPQVLALALRETSWPSRLLSQDTGHMVVVRVYSAHTHSVT